MSASIQVGADEFERLRRFVERECGVMLDGKAYLVETRLSRLLIETGSLTYGELLRRLEGDVGGALRDKLVDAITTHETSWFRDGSPWVGLRNKLLPEIGARARDERRRARIWSAACSTGQEPYAIAMLTREVVVPSSAPTPGGSDPFAEQRFEILATDVSASAVQFARLGRYDALAMSRGFDGEWRGYRDRYFETAGRTATVREDVRKRVTFQRLNLLESTISLGKFDLIMLRNVAIYFSADAKRALFDRMADQLLPNGALFLGSGETTNGYSERFRLELGQGYTCFRRK